ncbi:MAG: hypothetical protein M0P71_16440 [Melioribacteraceae bacterium]|nr:hypothetical protein [Melioribacteraceae bacterium]
MIPEIREKFNRSFSSEQYLDYIKKVWHLTDSVEDFRLSETPLYLTDELTDKLIESGDKIARHLTDEEFLRNSINAVPEDYFVPGKSEHPQFLQIDFAITIDANGSYNPMLIELQGFPSLYCFQTLVDKVNWEVWGIEEGYHSFFNGLNYESYLSELRKIILGNSSPENVILLEITPNKQKTRIDFSLTKELIGIEPVCISQIIVEGKNLFYLKDGKKTLIERIYNRVIFDELKRTDIKHEIDFKSEYKVEWVAHPNWFFRISKYSLPVLQYDCVPETYFLNEFEIEKHDISDFVLKPLYSFAGSGVNVNITKADIENIPDKENFIIQKKINYAPLIKTPEGFSKVEIRLMYLWDKEPILVNNLVRTSKGEMMGVDFNKGKTWVGSNIAYHRK